ncbi:MAG: Alpha-glycosidase [Clostridiales bacterium]|jgi:alpha-glucosidase|nr:Alpha-glycosidase [Bacillales bacterium]MDF2820384.1 Alpha-glycosidase [Clostridiales bacterium]
MNLHIPFADFTNTEKLLFYARMRQPILNERAIFSDETRNFRNPVEPTSMESTSIKLRTEKDNVEKVYLRYKEEKQLMIKVESDELFDYYEGVIPPTENILGYWFELCLGKIKSFYSKKGVTRTRDPYFDFRIAPNFHTPDWAKGAVMYQIYVDRFYNGDPSNDVLDNEYSYIGEHSKQVKEWEEYPSSFSVHEFYGGDLLGVIKKLDYLESLGIEAIYFNPLFVSPSNHKYDIQDYDYIDPHFGVILEDDGELLEKDDHNNQHATKYIKRVTMMKNLEASNKLFANVVEEAHKRGIKVILDGVFNHCGSFNKWMDKERFYSNEAGYEKGAHVDKESPYKSFFRFYDENAWPYNCRYDGWWGHETLPKLNYEGSEMLYEYVMKIAKKWVSPPYNIDGWRLDVAADLGFSKEFNHKFWRDFRKAVKEINPEAIILAEHYGDPSEWLKGDQWDTVMNYDAFMEPVTWFLTGMEKHSDEFRGDLLGNHRAFFDGMTYNMSRFIMPSLQVAMNELSNHDHSRFLTRTNHKSGRTHTLGSKAADEGVNIGIMREAVVIQMTWPGAPTVYYGDEAGVTGWTDPDNRRTYPWGNEDKALIQLHKELIKIHKSSNAFRTGSIKYLHGEYQLISYGRFDEKDKYVIVVNNSIEDKEVRIPVWEIGIKQNEKMVRIIQTTAEGFYQDNATVSVRKGKIMVKMPKFSAAIYKNA